MHSSRFHLPSPRVVLSLLLLLSLPLLSTGCATLSTRESRARTERPTLPQPHSELRQTERLKPLVGDSSGVMMQIDRGELQELYLRFADAVAAVERGNNRIGGWSKLWACVDAIWRTGKAPKGCETR